MILVCEVANSILVDIVIVDAEKRVGNSLVFWKLEFCCKTICSYFEHNAMFRQDFEVEIPAS